MSDALGRLLGAAEGVYPPLFNADDIESWPAELVDQLLRPSHPTSNVQCPVCGEMEEVVFIEAAKATEKRAFTRCAEIGPIEMPAELLKRWELGYLQLMDVAFCDIDLSGRREEVVRDRVWRLGKAKWSGASRNVFFARGLHRPDAWQIINHAGFAAGSVVFVPARPPVADSRIEVLPTVIPLTDVLAWTESGLCFDHDYVESCLAQARGAVLEKPARRTRKRADRTATIEALTKHLMVHVKAAREHALAKIEFGRDPELLPRPTKRHLARAAGVSEATVGRCIDDPTARELKFLWEMAEDLSQVLDYGPSSPV